MVCITIIVSLNDMKRAHLQCIDDEIYERATHADPGAPVAKGASFLAITKTRIQQSDVSEKLCGIVINQGTVRVVYAYMSTAVIGTVLGMLRG